MSTMSILKCQNQNVKIKMSKSKCQMNVQICRYPSRYVVIRPDLSKSVQIIQDLMGSVKLCQNECKPNSQNVNQSNCQNANQIVKMSINVKVSQYQMSGVIICRLS